MVKKHKIDLWKALKTDSSVKSLILVNLLVIIIAVWQNWSISTVLWIYWFQSIIIGFFTFLRILTLKKFSTKGVKMGGKTPKPTEGTKIIMAFFLAFHFGLFHFVYAIMITVLFGWIRVGQELLFIWIISMIFFANHLYSFIHNFEKDQKKVRNIGKIMFLPYARIIPMHVIIILGGALSFAGIGSQIILVLFLFLKTIADVIMHVVEHNLDF